MSERVQIQIGQVWENTGKRRAGRTFRVTGMSKGYVIVQVLQRSPSLSTLGMGRPLKIKLDRLTPHGGYRLRKDVVPETPNTAPATAASGA